MGGFSLCGDIGQLLTNVNRCPDYVPEDGNSLFECIARQIVHEDLQCAEILRDALCEEVLDSPEVCDPLFVEELDELAEDDSWKEEWENDVLKLLCEMAEATIILLESHVEPIEFIPAQCSIHSPIIIVKNHNGAHYMSTKSTYTSTHPVLSSAQLNQPQQQGPKYCE